MYLIGRNFVIKTAKEKDAKQIATLYKCSLENLEHRNELEEWIKQRINKRTGFSLEKCYTINDCYKEIIGAIFVKYVENSLEIKIWIPETEYKTLKDEIKKSLINFYKSYGYSYISKITILQENIEKPFSFKGYVEETNIVLKYRLLA